jgi:hypothetical protein
MAKYWYKIELVRAVTIEERKMVKSELKRLFASIDMPSGEGLTFEITSPLGPSAADTALADFAAKFGEARVTAGGKVE